MNRNSSLLAALFGFLLGALTIREYERVRGEEIAFESEMNGPPIPPEGPAPPPSIDKMTADPIEVRCDLCSIEFQVPPNKAGEVECPNCGNNTPI
jgi:hypothetical protein